MEMINKSDAKIGSHFGCFNYGKNKETPLIELRHYEKKERCQIVTKSNEIVIVLTGVLNFSFGHILNKQITEGAIVIFPAKHNCRMEMIEDTTLIIFRLDIDLSFCDHFSLETLYREKRGKRNEVHILNANTIIKAYLEYLTMLLNDGFYCDYLLKIKLREFLYILRFYSSMQELNAFFAPILSDDFKFSALIRKNYDPTLTVSDLAKKIHYSISGLEKRFKKVFGVSPFQWMQSQRSQAIYHEINCSTKTFAELGYEFGFSSPSHFNNFCKKMFNETPGNIRRKQ